MSTKADCKQERARSPCIGATAVASKHKQQQQQRGRSTSPAAVRSRATNNPKPKQSCAGTTAAAAAATEPTSQMRFKELIVKQETKNDELRRREEDQKERLKKLNSIIPAVFSWKWYKTHAKSEDLCKILNEATDANSCKITPSQHFDERVRAADAQLKEKQCRYEELRTALEKKETALQGQQTQIDLARQKQRESQERLKNLTEEARKRGNLASGEGGDGKVLAMIGSDASLKSDDLEQLEHLEQLYDLKARKRREIEELKKREETCMSVLLKAEELCASRALAEDKVTELKCELERAECRTKEAQEKLQVARDQLEASRCELLRIKSVQKCEKTCETAKDLVPQSDKETSFVPKTVESTCQSEAKAIETRAVGRCTDLAKAIDCASDPILPKNQHKVFFNEKKPPMPLACCSAEKFHRLQYNGAWSDRESFI
uniref:Uncharacterized protein n=1 Tax=Trichogramma kaykai TaxID=54128 RepID=A0ABD2WAR5_9HYME